MLRIESAINEPIENPVRGILFDRVDSRYNLLNQVQLNRVTKAISEKNARVVLRQKNPFLVDVELDELFENVDIVNLNSIRKDILSSPISVYLEISSRCNLQCVGCYQGKREETRILDTEQIETFLQEFASSGGMIVRFTGKEPTVHQDCIRIFSFAKKLGLKVALNSNGVLSYKKIRNIVEAGVSEVVISLDGRAETHNYFRGANIFHKTIASLKLFFELGVDTRINMTVSPLNIDDIEFVATLADSLGVYVSYIPIRNIGYATEGDSLTAKDMKKISQQITRLRKKVSVRLLTYFDIFGEESDYYHPMFQMLPCHARKNIFVTCSGDVYPCDHLVALGSDFCGGNIVDNEILLIWQRGLGLEKYRNIGICDDCTEECPHFRKSCYGGCASEAFFRKGCNIEKLPLDRLCPRS